LINKNDPLLTRHEDGFKIIFTISTFGIIGGVLLLGLSFPNIIGIGIAVGILTSFTYLLSLNKVIEFNYVVIILLSIVIHLVLYVLQLLLDFPLILAAILISLLIFTIQISIIFVKSGLLKPSTLS